MNRRIRRMGILASVFWTGTLLIATDIWAGPPGANELKIEVALNQVSTGQFIQEPLEQVAAFFADFHTIGIQIDHRALEAKGLDPSEPITLSASGIRLESMLEIILDPLGLTWTVRHECLVITTQEAAGREFSIRIYAIDDLFKRAGSAPNPYGGGYGGGGRSMTVSAGELVKVITTTVEPQSWKEDGPGGASILSIAGRVILVVRQDYRTHRKIQRLLDDLSQFGRDQPKEEAAPPAKADSRQPADDPFGAPLKPARPAADPFGAPAKPARPTNDPFGATMPSVSGKGRR